MDSCISTVLLFFITDGERKVETKVYTTYSMDYSSQRHHAQNKDGVWFTRSQYRDPRFGYKWTPWKKTNVAPRDMYSSQLMRVRLPKL